MNTATAYEHAMVREHARTHPAADVYHWSRVPENALCAAGYITDFNRHRHDRLMRREAARKARVQGVNPVRDYGFDGLSCEGGVASGLQAKFYKAPVKSADIATFSTAQMALTATNPASRGHLYTPGRLQADLAGHVANPRYPIQHVLFPWTPVAADAVATAASVPPPDVSSTALECDLPLRAYQSEALTELAAHAADAGGHLALNIPCRMGKTLLAGHHLRRLDPQLIVAIAPLRISVENLHQRLACFLPSHAALVVDSDAGGTTDPAEIRAFLATAGPKVIYSTYTSAVELLSGLLGEPGGGGGGTADDGSDVESEGESTSSGLSRDYNETLSGSGSGPDIAGFCLIDECHNANEGLCKFVRRFSQGLWMSATIPDELGIYIDHTVTISFERGIREGYLVDYTLWLPHLVPRVAAVEDTGPPTMIVSETETETDTDSVTDSVGSEPKTQVDIDDIPVEFSHFNRDLTAKAMFNAVCMLKTGSRRCIVYLASREECTAYVVVFRAVMEKFHGFFPREVWTGVIVSDVGRVERDRLLREFQEGPDTCFHLLASVRILDEAVDLVRCDSEFVTIVGEQSSDIRMTQRALRGSTVDPNNPSKRNNVFLWCDAWRKCVGALELLKSMDPEFHKKIRIADTRYDGSASVERVATVEGARTECVEWMGMRCMTWMEKHMLKIQELKRFYEEFGEGPKDGGKRPNEKQLAKWMSRRRQDKKKGILNPTLEAILFSTCPWFLFNPFATALANNFQGLTEFYNEHGEAPKNRGTRLKEQHLYQWISDIRKDKKKGKLDSVLETTLNEKFSWLSLDPIADAHTLMISDIKQFHAEHGTEPKQKGGKSPNETNMAKWMTQRRTDKKNNKLADVLENALFKSCPWFKFDPATYSHMANIRDLKEFYDKYGKMPGPTGTLPNEQTLGHWVNMRRQNKRNNNLDPLIESALMAALPSFSFNPIVDARSAILHDLDAFLKEFGETPKCRGIRPKESMLYTWISERRKNKKKGNLDSDLERQIRETLPWFSFDPIADAHTTAIRELKAFHEEHGEGPKQEGKRPNEKQLASWLSSRRQEKKKGTLTPDLERQIREALPWFTF